MVTLKRKELPRVENAAFRVVRGVLESIRRDSLVLQAGKKDEPFAWNVGLVGILGYSEKMFPESERGIIEYALACANGETVMPSPGQDAEALRARLRGIFWSVLTDRKAAVRTLLAESRTSLERLWLLPILRATPGGVRLENRMVFLDEASLCFYIEVLLLDDARAFGKDLCRCRRPGCERLFLAQKPATGRPQRRYCTREHMLEAHALGSTRRARRSRARRAAARRAK